MLYLNIKFSVALSLLAATPFVQAALLAPPCTEVSSSKVGVKEDGIIFTRSSFRTIVLDETFYVKGNRDSTSAQRRRSFQAGSTFNVLIDAPNPTKPHLGLTWSTRDGDAITRFFDLTLFTHCTVQEQQQYKDLIEVHYYG